jgi:hypothetical protein
MNSAGIHIILIYLLTSGYALGMLRVSSYQEVKTGHLQQSQNFQKELNQCFDTGTQCGRTHTILLKIIVNVADDKLRITLHNLV